MADEKAVKAAMRNSSNWRISYPIQELGPMPEEWQPDRYMALIEFRHPTQDWCDCI